MEGGGRDDQSGTCGFGKGTEKIGAHTSNVTYIVTDVISDGSRVFGTVLGKVGFDLSDQIGANISGFGVDTSSDSAE